MRTLRALLVLLAVVLVAERARAEEGSLTLEVDLERVGIEDSFTVSVAVAGDGGSGLGEPELDLGGHFQVVGRSRSQSVSFIQGVTRVESRFLFTVRPLREGVFDIGPATARAGARTLTSGTARVQVVPGSIAPSASGRAVDPWSRVFGGPSARRRRSDRGKVILVAALDKTEAYAGEQVTYTLRLLTQRSVQSVKPRSEPQLSGMWVEALEVANPPQAESTVEDGEAFTSFLLKKSALFPTTAGDIRIEPTIWDLAVVVDDSLFGEVDQIARQSEPLVLSVRPLPEEGRPEGFAGAVGKLTVEAVVDKPDVEVNEAVNLKVTVSGTGNLKGFPAPQLGEVGDFKLYGTTASEERKLKAGKLGGSRTWEIVLVPRAPGEHTIPAIRYPYFDPEAGRYGVALSKAIAVSVRKGDTEVATAAAAAALAPGLRKGEPVRRDVAYLKLAAGALSPARVPFYRRGPVQGALLLPILLNVGAVVYLLERRRATGDPVTTRRRGAYRAAIRRLDAADRLLGGKGAVEFSDRVTEAIVGYIADRFGEPQAGLTRERITALVAERGGADGGREIGRILERLDYLRFTPAGADPAELRRLVKEAGARLRSLDRGAGRARVA